MELDILCDIYVSVKKNCTWNFKNLFRNDILSTKFTIRSSAESPVVLRIRSHILNKSQYETWRIVRGHLLCFKIQIISYLGEPLILGSTLEPAFPSLANQSQRPITSHFFFRFIFVKTFPLKYRFHVRSTSRIKRQHLSASPHLQFISIQKNIFNLSSSQIPYTKLQHSVRHHHKHQSWRNNHTYTHTHGQQCHSSVTPFTSGGKPTPLYTDLCYP